MNSNSKKYKVGIKTSHRKSLQKNLLSDLIIYEYLTTTKQKSKLVIGKFYTLVGIAKSDKEMQFKERLLFKKLGNENAVNKLLDVYTKRFEKEASGLVRVFKLNTRKGDSGELVKLMIKGYVYKDIGSKVRTDKKKKEVKEQDKSVKALSQKDLSAQSQVAGNVSAAKIKTRSGI